MSSAVSSTCPIGCPCLPNAAAYASASRSCPTAAAACCVARSRGLRVSPSGASPAAIAPDDTSTTWLPAARRAASASTSACNRDRSSPPSRLVSEDDPTLTTSRRAAASWTRVLTALPPACTPAASRVLVVLRGPQLLVRAVTAAVGARGLAFGRRHPAALLQAPVGAAAGHHDGHAGRGARLPVERDVADRDRAARLRACLGVVEGGLPDPALGPRAAHDETAGQLRIGLDCEAGVVDGLGAQDDPRGLGHRLCRAVRVDLLGHGERELAQPGVGRG